MKKCLGWYFATLSTTTMVGSYLRGIGLDDLDASTSLQVCQVRNMLRQGFVNGSQWPLRTLNSMSLGTKRTSLIPLLTSYMYPLMPIKVSYIRSLRFCRRIRAARLREPYSEKLALGSHLAILISCTNFSSLSSISVSGSFTYGPLSANWGSTLFSLRHPTSYAGGQVSSSRRRRQLWALPLLEPWQRILTQKHQKRCDNFLLTTCL